MVLCVEKNMCPRHRTIDGSRTTIRITWYSLTIDLFYLYVMSCSPKLKDPTFDQLFRVCAIQTRFLNEPLFSVDFDFCNRDISSC